MLSYNPTSSEITYSNVGSDLKITMLVFNEINQAATTIINEVYNIVFGGSNEYYFYSQITRSSQKFNIFQLIKINAIESSDDGIWLKIIEISD